jgi:uncharacterized protein (TIGR02996 family)
MAKKSRVSPAKKASRALTQDDHDFIGQILASPEEDAPRLAYADWLEVQGDRDRAEFIRCQIEAARLAPQDPRRDPAQARAAALLQEHQAEWEAAVSDFAGVGRVCVFERGFPVWARFCITDFPQDIAPRFPRIWQAAPVTHLDLYDINAAAAFEPDPDFDESWIRVASYQALANMPQLVHIRSLSVCECAIQAEHLKPLLASPHLTNLRELHLSSNRLGNAGAGVVAEAPVAAGLTLLDLGTNEMGNEGAVALAQSPHLANLKTLLLQYNFISEEGGRALANSTHLSHLDRLGLDRCPLATAEGELRQRFGNRFTV